MLKKSKPKDFEVNKYIPPGSLDSRIFFYFKLAGKQLDIELNNKQIVPFYKEIP